MRRSSHCARGRRRAGVTLVELVITLVVVAIALVGVLQAVRAAVGGSADPMLVHQATAIAEAHLEEILARPFYDPDLGAGGGACPAPEASRALYDNPCDYDGLDDTGPRDQTGTPVAGLEAYRVRVTVDADPSLGGLTGADGVLRVDVRVSHPAGTDITVSGYRAAY